MSLNTRYSEFEGEENGQAYTIKKFGELDDFTDVTEAFKAGMKKQTEIIQARLELAGPFHTVKEVEEAISLRFTDSAPAFYVKKYLYEGFEMLKLPKKTEPKTEGLATKIELLPMKGFSVYKSGEGETSPELYDCLYLGMDKKLRVYGLGLGVRIGSPYGSMLAGSKPHSLYVTQLVPIKDGDWFVRVTPDVTEVIRTGQRDVTAEIATAFGYRKVIATSDTKLQPQVSSLTPAIIEHYVNKYNLGEAPSAIYYFGTPNS
jgi:hypothetical protein